MRCLVAYFDDSDSNILGHIPFASNVEYLSGCLWIGQYFDKSDSQVLHVAQLRHLQVDGLLKLDIRTPHEDSPYARVQYDIRMCCSHWFNSTLIDFAS